MKHFVVRAKHHSRRSTFSERKGLAQQQFPLATELPVMTSSSPTGLAEVPSLLIKKTLRDGIVCACSQSRRTVKTSFVTGSVSVRNESGERRRVSGTGVHREMIVRVVAALSDP